MNSAQNGNAGSAACSPQRRLRRPVNEVLHRKRRPATVLSIATLVVMLEKERSAFEVSVLRVRIEQLAGVRAAFGRDGELEVLGGAGRTCIVVFWRNDPTGSPARFRAQPAPQRDRILRDVDQGVVADPFQADPPETFPANRRVPIRNGSVSLLDGLEQSCLDLGRHVGGRLHV
jgi:hypothetical protein